MSGKPKPVHPWRVFQPGWLTQRTPNERQRDTTYQRVLRK